MAGQQRTSSHPTPWVSIVDIAKQNVFWPPPSKPKDHHADKRGP